MPTCAEPAMPDAIADDARDLAAWVAVGDDAAFSRVVGRHAHLVAATCRRQLGKAEIADEAAQAVFLVLARRARSLGDPDRLAPWLYGVALKVCRNARRTLIRRARHEREAMIAHAAATTSTDAEWADLRPRLDEALTALSAAQRDAVIGFYLEGLPQAAVARRLGISEDAVKMRVHAAIDKLRGWFLRRGLTIGAAALAAGLASEARAAESAVLAVCAGAALPHAAKAGAVALANGVATGTAKLVTAVIGAVLAVSGGIAVVSQARNLDRAAQRVEVPAALAPAIEAPIAEAPAAEVQPAIGADLERILAAPVDVRYELRYPGEVLDDLRSRIGLRSAMPDTIDHLPFTLHQAGIPVRTVLEKLAKDCRIEVEYRGGRALISQRADDQVIAALTKELKQADRWKRCEAAFRLGRLADKRIYPLLAAAVADPQPMVGAWALRALAAHADVIAYVDGLDRDALTAAIVAALKRQPPDSALLTLLLHCETAASVDAFIDTFHSPVAERSKRAPAFLVDRTLFGTLGLACSHQPRAIETVLALAAKEPDRYGLHAALGRIDDPRAIALLIEATRKEAPAPAPASGPGHVVSVSAWGGTGGGATDGAASAYRELSRSADPAAVAAVVQLWQDHAKLLRLAPSLDLSAHNPAVAEAMLAGLDDEDANIRQCAMRALCDAGHPRGIDAAITYAMQQIDGDKTPENQSAAEASADMMRHGQNPDLPSRQRGLDLLATIPDQRARQRVLDLCAAHWLTTRPMNRRWNDVDWTALALRTRDPAIPDKLFATLGDAQASAIQHCRAACALASDGACLSRVDRLDRFLLDSSDKGLVREFVLAHVVLGQGTVFFRQMAADAAFAADARWVPRLAALVHEPYPIAEHPTSSMGAFNVLVTDRDDGGFALVSGDPAIAALAKASSPQAAQALVVACADADRGVRSQALDAIQSPWWRIDPEVTDAMAKLLADADPGVQAQAAIALGSQHDQRAIPRLRALTDERPTRESGYSSQQQPWRAAELLLEMGDPSARAAFIALAEDPAARVSDGDLGVIDTELPQAKEILRAIMVDDVADTDVRSQAAMALLAKSADPEALKSLLALVRVPPRHGVSGGISLDAVDTNSRNRVISALQKRRDPAIDDALVALIRDPDVSTEARDQVLMYLDANSLGDRAKAALGDQVADADLPIETRLQIGVMLCGRTGYMRMGNATVEKVDPRVLRTITDLYQAEPPTDQLGRVVSEVLARSGDAAAIKVLKGDLGSDTVAVRIHAALALTQFVKDPAAIDLVIDLAEDEHDPDRYWAQTALTAIKDDPKIDDAQRKRIAEALPKR